MNFGEESRMSSIRDHNIYNQTDQLYQPLRAALRKSTVHQNQRVSQILPKQLGRSIRSLSPAEVETIVTVIAIREAPLVPTANISKVKGKRFTAVDVVETVGEPIDDRQLSRVRSGAIEQIVYEVQDDSRKSNNIYTSRESFPDRGMITHKRQPIFNYQTSDRRSIFREIMPQAQSRVQESFSRGQMRRSQANRPELNIYTASPVKEVPIYYNQQSREISRKSKQMKEVPIYYNQSNKELANKSVTSFTKLPKESNSGQSESVFRSELGSKSYDFRGSAVSERTRLSRSRKEEYRYNLFSILDQPGNSGCRNGCFHSNELIASRIGSNPWK